MMFLSHLFYFSGLLLFLANIGLLTKINSILKVQSWSRAFSKVTKKQPEKSDMQSEQYKDLMNYNSVILADFFWVFFGIITSNWKFSLLTIAIMLIFNFLLNLSNNKLFLKSFNFLKLILMTVSIGLLVINHFHLHMDLFEEIKKISISLF